MSQLRDMLRRLITVERSVEMIPPPPKRITGRNLWLYRSLFYLPLHGYIIALTVYGTRTSADENIWQLWAILVVGLTAMTTIQVRYERRNGLHLPTLEDIEFFILYSIFFVILRPLTQFLENGHVDKEWSRGLMISLGFVLFSFPNSIVLNGSKRKSGAPNSEVAP